MEDAIPGTLLIIIPSYNDWGALLLLLRAIDASLAKVAMTTRIVIIDDGSETPAPTAELAERRSSLASVAILRLRTNLGHQRAIATSLAWIDANAECDAVLVMDGDGEDSPTDIPRLIECYQQSGCTRVVFAERQRRSEGIVFQAFYHLYRAAHWVLTGIGVRVGNFSLIPRDQLHRLVVVSDLWNHYAAAVFKARLPTAMVPTARSRRLDGVPKMNFTQLVVHGLSAISVFRDRVGVRLLIATAIFGTIILLASLTFTLSNPVPNEHWNSRLLLGMAVAAYITVNMLAIVGLFAFSVLGGRDSAAFLPARDYVWFVRDHTSLWRNDE